MSMIKVTDCDSYLNVAKTLSWRLCFLRDELSWKRKDLANNLILDKLNTINFGGIN